MALRGGGGMARKPICPTPPPSLVAVPGGGFALGLPYLPCRGGGGLGWVGLGHGSHRRRVPTASVSFPHQHDWALPRLSGRTAPQTIDDPRTPPRRWWEGDTAVPVCMSRALRASGGFTARGQGTVAHLLSPLGCGPPVSVWRGMCVSGAPGPSSGAGEPYTKAARGVCRSGDLLLPPSHD